MKIEIVWADGTRETFDPQTIELHPSWGVLVLVFADEPQMTIPLAAMRYYRQMQPQ